MDIESMKVLAEEKGYVLVKTIGCRDCNHWKDEKGSHYSLDSNIELGICSNTPHYSNATEWDEDGNGRRLKEKYKDREAFAEDGSGYRAYLLTAANFYCKSYQQREL